MADPNQTIIATRGAQMFPVLSPDEMARLRRFGEGKQFRQGEALATVGKPGLGLVLILDGEVEISQHDETGRRTHIVTHQRGSFMGELAQLSGRPSLVDADALTDVEAVAVAPDRLRALLIAEADLGERIMRALILRRVGLIEAGAGPVIVGEDDDADVLRLVNFLAPQRPSLPEPRSGRRQLRADPDRTVPGRAGGIADRAVPGRPAAAQSERGAAGALRRAGRADRSGQAVRRRGHRCGAGGACHLGLCGIGRPVACWRSTAARSAARRAHRRGSRITLASRPGFRAWR